MRNFKRKIHRGRGLAAVGLAFMMLMSACGQEPVSAPEIELIDPVASANVSETVTRRTIYEYEVLDGGVFPVVTEYSAATGMNAADIGYFPGQRVAGGSTLFSGNMQDYYDQEKSVRNQLDDLIVNYAENWRVNHLKLKDYDYFIESRSRDLEDNLEIAIVVQRKMFERDLLEQMMEDDEDIFMLDALHYNQLLYRLQVNESRRRVRSGMSGTVVAVSNVSPGAYVSEGTNVAAVTDGKSLNILATYRSAKDIAAAEEVYAVINGKRYSVNYIPYSTGEISSLKASGRTVYSVFEIDDPESSVKAGQKASIVVIKNKYEDVLSVSREAVHRDEGGYFVLRTSGEKVYITRGISDGMFTEILDGLNEGDEVMLDSYNEVPENVATLRTGDYYQLYEGAGSLGYPDITNISNDVKYGTVTLVRKNVTEGQRVSRGDVIAYVSVAENSVILEELYLRQLRLQERREKAQETVDDPLTEYLSKDVQEQLKNAVSVLDRQIASINEQMAEITASYTVTAFTSPVDGVVGYITDLSDGAVLKSGERIATVAAGSAEYLYAQNDAGTLLYGMELTGEYTDPVSGEKITFPASVSSVSFGAVSNDLASDRVYVMPAQGVTLPGGVKDPNAQIAAEIPSGQAASINNPWEAWLAQQAAANAPAAQSYKLSGYTQYETGVVLVPAKAVTFAGKQAYVTVFEDGKYIRRGFIAGGADPIRSVTIDSVAYIWSIEGLEEGMVVVY